MKTITVLGYRRPKYLEQCLAALAECRGFASYHTVVSIDGGDDARRMECAHVARRFSLSTGCTVIPRATNLGINRHNAWAYDVAFGMGSEYNVCVEDDAVLSPDALELADWFLNLPNCDEYCLCSLGNCLKNPGDPGLVDEVVGLGTSWAFTFTDKQRPWILKEWNETSKKVKGWDWSLTAKMFHDKKLALVPQLSRVKNIGRYGGVNTYDSWWLENMEGLPCSDGLQKVELKLVKLTSYPSDPDWL